MRPYDLFVHAERLLQFDPTEADIRRAASASYYALFHVLTSVSAQTLGAGKQDFTDSLRRRFDHSAMREACDAIRRPDSVLAPSPALASVAVTFIDLQTLRHRADYDLVTPVLIDEARDALQSSHEIAIIWALIADTEEGRVFSVLLLMGRLRTRRG